MEDDNGLDLTLGLPCSGSSAISKGKKSSSSDTRTDEGDRGNKLIDDFKYFLDGGNQKHDSAMGSQRSNPVKPEEIFFNNLSSGAVNVDASTNLNSQGFWLANDNRSSEVVQEGRSNAGSKRKSSFNENNHQKKHEGEAHNANLHDKTHISITTEEGSTADNEDVADSEAEGSTSKLVPHHVDISKRQNGGSGSTEVLKEVHGVSNSSGVDFSPENEFKFVNAPYGVSFPPNIMNVPHSLLRQSNPIAAPGSSIYSLPGMQVRAAANSERPVNQSVMPTNLPAMFGYSPVHVPMLDKDNSRGLVSHSQQLNPSYFGRGPENSDKSNDGLKISQATQYDGRTLERAKSSGPSSQREDDSKGSITIARGTDGPNQPRKERSPSEVPAIRPGIAGDVKFGGCGSYPNLPWVTTTGPGPNGRQISGVTYRFSATQIRIVCACHGTHMSPEEFIRHAGEEQTNPDTSSGLASIPTSNPAASAQS